MFGVCQTQEKGESSQRRELAAYISSMFLTFDLTDACFIVIVVRLLSHVRLFATPWTEARQASLSITSFWSLLKLMSIESVMPSNHLILCHPLLLQPSIFPSIGVFPSESAALSIGLQLQRTEVMLSVILCGFSFIFFPKFCIWYIIWECCSLSSPISSSLQMVSSYKR